MPGSLIPDARQRFLLGLREKLLWLDPQGIATNADVSSRASVAIARELASGLGVDRTGPKLSAQTQGAEFERLIEQFLRETFLSMGALRPGSWSVGRLTGATARGIANYDQYAHLDYLKRAAAENRELAAALGRDYEIDPDAVIYRNPETDEFINQGGNVVDSESALHAPVRRANNGRPILHACVSCKWTVRSDRAQNVRTEALNLIRNRKGALPHIVAVTGEPMPARIAALALGTGDLDCVYHFALPELTGAIARLGMHDSAELLATMVEGRRLRDISDLPLDLAT